MITLNYEFEALNDTYIDLEIEITSYNIGNDSFTHCLGTEKYSDHLEDFEYEILNIPDRHNEKMIMEKLNDDDRFSEAVEEAIFNYLEECKYDI